jgi:hypothetical protein
VRALKRLGRLSLLLIVIADARLLFVLPVGFGQGITPTGTIKGTIVDLSGNFQSIDANPYLLPVAAAFSNVVSPSSHCQDATQPGTAGNMEAYSQNPLATNLGERTVSGNFCPNTVGLGFTYEASQVQDKAAGFQDVD